MGRTDASLLNAVPVDLVHLIPGFLDRREQEVRQLIELLERGRFDEIRLIGHKLKGTGTGYGFPLVTDIGRELEACALQEDRERIAELTAELSQFAADLKSTLLASAA
jgi:hypothetical protein